jgi:DHA1 family bicyclomycin/chloramphenicol resistance-like MFS transporter
MTRRSTFTLTLVLGGLTGLVPLAIDMYLPAFPQIAGGLHASAAQVQLTLTACLLGLAAGQLGIGPASDARGRKRPLLVGVGGYVLASFGCAIAPNLAVLTACRTLQGLSGAAGVVLSRAIVADLYSGPAAARFFSRLILVFGLAPMLAPILGGQVLRFASWKGIFVILAAAGALMLVAAAFALPETLPVERRRAGGLGETLRALRVASTDRAFIGFTLALAFGFAGMFAYISGSPFVVQKQYGASPQLFGLLFGVNALGFVAASQVNGWLVVRVAPRHLLLCGLVGELSAGVGLLAAVLAGLGLPFLAVGMFALLASLGFVAPNATALALGRQPRRAGSASALMGTVQFVIAASVAPLVGMRGGDALSMATVIAICAGVALTAFVTLTRRTPATAALEVSEARG